MLLKSIISIGDIMFKFIFKVVKRIIISSFLLYGYNLLVQPIGLIIPINVITVGSLTVLGVPALMGLIFIMIFVY